MDIENMAGLSDAEAAFEILKRLPLDGLRADEDWAKVQALRLIEAALASRRVAHE